MSVLPQRKYVRVKLLSMGDSGVGKSCLVKRYCEQKFVARYISTIGVDFGVRSVVLEADEDSSKDNKEGLEVRVNFWDLSGDADFVDVRTEFYEATQAVLLVFDVNDKASFVALDKWVAEAAEHHCRPLVGAVAANKVDEPAAQRQVSESEARRWASAHGYQYFETSAKSGQEVNAMFAAVLQTAVTALRAREAQVG